MAFGVDGATRVAVLAYNAPHGTSEQYVRTVRQNSTRAAPTTPERSDGTPTRKHSAVPPTPKRSEGHPQNGTSEQYARSANNSRAQRRDTNAQAQRSATNS